MSDTEIEGIFKEMGHMRRIRESGCHQFVDDWECIAYRCKRCALSIAGEALQGHIPEAALDLLAACPSSLERVTEANRIIGANLTWKGHDWSQRGNGEAQ